MPIIFAFLYPHDSSQLTRPTEVDDRVKQLFDELGQDDQPLSAQSADIIEELLAINRTWGYLRDPDPVVDLAAYEALQNRIEQLMDATSASLEQTQAARQAIGQIKEI